MSKPPRTTFLWPILAAALGALLGLIGARYIFVGSALSLVPWGLAALIIGLLSKTWATAASRSALFGFCLAGTFMLAGYQGTVPVTNHLIPFAIIGLVGALCAIAGATVGRLVRTKVRARS
ncbi:MULTISPECIES: hypothetical protein [Arthrobacter]|jgi:hypothetical protein|uniref:Uncharacterized protein n=1 Tax=Arthrobacter wenxiniae TaxID=2713570 RepID=A0A7Y7IJQ6_9MICC|nr:MULTISPECIES: hypothetical protein [Arthrobacter]MCU6480652.1 hypothetical protein [Arthrobacter sp. A2-55]NVM96726.1 hypothetical protein [Arthrobacter wenxiniae]